MEGRQGREKIGLMREFDFRAFHVQIIMSSGCETPDVDAPSLPTAIYSCSLCILLSCLCDITLYIPHEAPHFADYLTLEG